MCTAEADTKEQAADMVADDAGLITWSETRYIKILLSTPSNQASIAQLLQS